MEAALASDAVHRSRIASESNSVTAGNVMEWESLEPARGEYARGPADRARARAPVARPEPGVAVVTVGGCTDKHSWVPGWFEGEGAADILDENSAAKPAYRALRDDLSLGGTRRRG